jgi:hypothetical protein
MTAKERTTGQYVNVYLARPVYLHIEQQALKEQIGMAAWVRRAVLAACPPEIRNRPKGSGRGRYRRGSPKPAQDVQTAKGQEGAGAKSVMAAFEDAAERSRDKVIALAARGYRENAISAIAQLPYRVVQQILNTPPGQPNKRRKK